MSLAQSRSVQLFPPTAPINASAAVPGSKSVSNRALVLAALSSGESHLTGLSHSDDSRALMHGLRSLGVVIEETGDAARVLGLAGSFAPFRGTIDVGAGGTTIRFLLPLCTLAGGGEIVLEGTERMHSRPIGDLVGALGALGADIQFQGNPGCPPLFVRGKPALRGGSVSLGGSISSQFLSSLLMVSPCFERGLEIKVQGEQVSRPYIEMTLALMSEFGVTVDRDDFRHFTVPAGQRYQSRSYRIEGDASGATYLWGLAAINRGSVRVTNLALHSVQGDMRFPEILERMGCTVARGGSGADAFVEVAGPATLRSVEVDLEDMPDTAQTLAVVASVAEGTTVMRGLQTLRVKETDRIAALVNELAQVGIAAEAQGDDTLAVHGGSPHEGVIETYEDHRMAMSFALLGARIPGMEILAPRVVQKSFPDFWEVLGRCGVGLKWVSHGS